LIRNEQLLAAFMGKMNKTGVTLTDLVQESMKNLTEDDLLKAEAENEYHTEIDQEANRQRILDSFDLEMVSDFEAFKDAFEHTNLDEYLECLDTKSKRQQQLDSYVRFSRLEPQRLIDELNEKRERCLQDLTSTKFGTELLANFTLEVFLRLFDPRPRLQVYNLDGKHLNDYGTDFSSARKSIVEAYFNYIVFDSKLEELYRHTPPAEKQITAIEPTSKVKAKPGRKKTIVAESFSLKDVATPEQIEVINKLLLDNKYIHEIDGKYFISDNKYTNRFASIIKALPKYNYCSSLTSEQAFYILKNDFKVNTTQNTVNQAKDTKVLSIFNLKR
jgi:hypothetical protein